MTRALQPMIQYTVITKDITKIDGNNKLEAILIYAYIKSRENYTTHMLDNLTYEEIHFHLDVPVQTVKNIVPTLYVNKSLFKGYEYFYKDNKTYIKYNFHETYPNFFYINNSLFKLDNYSKIPTKYVNQVRGFLLLLKAHCLNGTNCYFFQRKSKSGINYAELSRVFNMDRDTIEKYLSKALDGGLIKKIPNGLAIMDRNIYPYYFKKNLYDDIYKDLFNWCLKKNLYPPYRDNSYLGVLWAHYPLLSKDIIEFAKMNDAEPNLYFKMMRENRDKFQFIHNYLLYELTIRRVMPKNGYLTWNYLFKALNLKLPTKPQPQYFTM
jgi:hypothetical protein